MRSCRRRVGRGMTVTVGPWTMVVVVVVLVMLTATAMTLVSVRSIGRRVIEGTFRLFG